MLKMLNVLVVNTKRNKPVVESGEIFQCGTVHSKSIIRYGTILKQLEDKWYKEFETSSVTFHRKDAIVINLERVASFTNISIIYRVGSRCVEWKMSGSEYDALSRYLGILPSYQMLEEIALYNAYGKSKNYLLKIIRNALEFLRKGEIENLPFYIKVYNW